MADVFDRFITGINKGIASASENSKLILEKAKLNSQVHENEEVKLKLSQELGIMAYTMQTKGDINIEQFCNICNSITNINNQIERIKADIKKLETSKFKETSASAVEVATDNTNSTLNCTCGFTNKSDAKYCARCGKFLK